MNLIETCTEVYEILSSLGDEYIKKLPPKLYEFIENNRDENSIITYDMNKDILSQDVSEDTRDFIAYMNLNYWCSEEEKEELTKQYKINDEKYLKLIRDNYSNNTYKKDKQNTQLDDNINKEKYEIIETKEESFIMKLLRRIANFVNDKF